MKQATKRLFKGELFTQFARIGRALSSPHRLELLDVLAQGERTVDQLAAETDLSIANASQHLQVLRQAELTTTRRDGSRVWYRLASPEVFALWQALRKIPAGRTATYTEVAKRIGRPRAVRAVAAACADNPVAVAIPCHRVVRLDGNLAGYRWGIARKRALLAKEAAA